MILVDYNSDCQLISKNGDDCNSMNTVCNSDSPTFIAAIGWAKDPKDNFSMIVELNGMCDPCWEYMKFDPITGIFGESIGHGSF